MNIEKFPYPGGSYRPFSQIGSSGIVRVYRSLHVPKSSIQVKHDYPMCAHRILKILPEIHKNAAEYDALRTDERNFDITHPNLIRVERSLTHEACFVVSMEDMCGSIHQLLKSKRLLLNIGMPEKAFCLILTNVLEALAYIHSRGAVHGNLDTWSIFYTTQKSPAIKLIGWAADFKMGILRKEDKRITGNRRTTEKVFSPERRGADQSDYTSKCDIWHFGLTAIEMAMGELKKEKNETADHFINAFHLAHVQPLAQNVSSRSNMQIRGRLMTETMSIRVLGHHFSPEFVDFIVQCTHNQPDERAGAETLLQHPFLKKHATNEGQLQMFLTEAQGPYRF